MKWSHVITGALNFKYFLYNPRVLAICVWIWKQHSKVVSRYSKESSLVLDGVRHMLMEGDFSAFRVLWFCSSGFAQWIKVKINVSPDQSFPTLQDSSHLRLAEGANIAQRHFRGRMASITICQGTGNTVFFPQKWYPIYWPHICMPLNCSVDRSWDK